MLCIQRKAVGLGLHNIQKASRLGNEKEITLVLSISASGEATLRTIRQSHRIQRHLTKLSGSGGCQPCDKLSSILSTSCTHPVISFGQPLFKSTSTNLLFLEFIITCSEAERGWGVVVIELLCQHIEIYFIIIQKLLFASSGMKKYRYVSYYLDVLIHVMFVTRQGRWCLPRLSHPLISTGCLLHLFNFLSSRI